MRYQVLGASFWAIVGQGFSLVASILSAQLLLPNDRGLMASLVLLLTIGGLGSSLGTNVAFRSMHPKGQFSLRRYRLLSAALLMIHTPVVLVGVLLVGVTTDIVVMSPAVLVMSLIFGWSGFIGAQLLDGLNAQAAFSKSGLANAAGLVATSGCFALLLALPRSYGLVSALGAFAIGNCVRVWVCRTFLRQVRNSERSDELTYREVVRKSLHYLPFSFGMMLLYRIDVPLVAATVNASASAMYSVAGTLVSLPQFFSTSVAQAGLSMAASGTHSRRKMGLHLTAAGGVTVIYGVVLSAIAPLLVPWVFGSEYRQAASLVPILCVGQVGLAIVILSSRVMAGLGLTRPISWGFGVAIVVLIAGSLLLQPILGLYTVAWTSGGVLVGLGLVMLYLAIQALDCSLEGI